MDDGGGGAVDTSDWPQVLLCESRGVRDGAHVVEQMNQAQWYVRLEDSSRGMLGLEGFVNVLVQKEIVFEIKCSQGGVMFLCGLDIPPYGQSLVAVYRPPSQSLHNTLTE